MSDIPLRFALVLACILSAAGCDKEPLKVALNPDVVKGWSYAAMAAATFEQPSSPAPAPAPQPSPGGKCETCNGTGRVGDGRVSAVCQDCGGDGVTQALQVKTSACVCGDCKCDPCKCVASDCPGGVCRLPQPQASSPGAPRSSTCADGSCSRPPARVVPRFRLFRR